jgi:hypothetical protein
MPRAQDDSQTSHNYVCAARVRRVMSSQAGADVKNRPSALPRMQARAGPFSTQAFHPLRGVVFRAGAA